MCECVGGAVEIEVMLLDVLAMVAFGASQPEETLLQDQVLLVPQRHREAHHLLAIADAGEAIFVPAIRARSRMLVRNTPRPCRRRCSPRARCPRHAR